MAAGDPKFRVMADVVRLLETNEALSAAVGARIFPLVAPLKTPGDHIIYQRDGVELQSSKMQGFAMFKVFFFISVFSDDYFRGLAISENVYKALVGSHDGFKIEFHDLTESLVDQKFVQILKLSIQ
jgi:hypothetical protein